jgi:hypothetical protein
MAADLAKLKIGDFAPHLNSAFEMQTPAGAVPLKLVYADGDSEAVKGGREGGSFSLGFVAPQGRWLPQGTYPVKHPTLGTLEIFLVPSGALHDGHGYHATFG